MKVQIEVHTDDPFLMLTGALYRVRSGTQKSAGVRSTLRLGKGQSKSFELEKGTYMYVFFVDCGRGPFRIRASCDQGKTLLAQCEAQTDRSDPAPMSIQFSLPAALRLVS